MTEPSEHPGGFHLSHFARKNGGEKLERPAAVEWPRAGVSCSSGKSCGSATLGSLYSANAVAHV